MSVKSNHRWSPQSFLSHLETHTHALTTTIATKAGAATASWRFPCLSSPSSHGLAFQNLPVWRERLIGFCGLGLPFAVITVKICPPYKTPPELIMYGAASPALPTTSQQLRFLSPLISRWWFKYMLRGGATSSVSFSFLVKCLLTVQYSRLRSLLSLPHLL